MEEVTFRATKKTLMKVILIGDCQVGKTALVRRYMDDDFLPYYLPTILPKYSVKEVKTRGKQILLQIWDTSGRDEFFEYLGANFYRDTDCSVLVFDTTRRESFDSLNKWLNEFLIHADPRNLANFPVVCVGTKADLHDARQVTRSEVEQWCLSKCVSGECNVVYFEISTKNSSAVRHLFSAIAKHVISTEAGSDNAAKPELPLLSCCCNIC